MAGLTATEGAYLTSCFWGTFAVGRLVAIGVATKLSPAFMIMFNIVSFVNAAVQVEASGTDFRYCVSMDQFADQW